MNNYFCLFAFLLLTGLLLQSCETPFVPDTIEADQQFVVEGFVEAGEGALPTYVIITRSLPFVGEIGPEQFSELFVHDAIVKVNDGDKETILPELCLDDLPDGLRAQVATVLGFDPDSISLNFCAYADVLGQIIQEQGRSYDLSIDIGSETQLSATTTIPIAVPLFDLTWEDPPGDPNDTMATLKVTINDPFPAKNFYRYFTASEGQPLVSPFTSVVDDGLFDGQEFEFPLSRAVPRGADIDPNTFGLWPRQDSITLKWCTIDEEHFNFWRTFDFNNNNQGPFSSYTRVASNVDGALGVWGGYAVNYYDEFVEVK